MGSVPPCFDCGGIGRHKVECSSLTLEEKLLQRYGRDVPDGDGWSWDWESDPLIIQAVDELHELRRLKADCSTCTKCGHIQVKPDWCEECGHRVTMPEWAALLVMAYEAQERAKELVLEALEAGLRKS